jgi:hypothetical protein
MFVRWKRRERTTASRRARRKDPSGRTGRFLLSAVLVQSERRDGKPRQKVVAYLGCISEDRVGDMFPRKHFWDKVGRRLDTLRLEPEIRREVEAALLTRVAQLTAEEMACYERKRKALNL